MTELKPGKIKTIRPETIEFIALYTQLKGKAFHGNAELAETLGFNSASSITEIIKSRQNIDPDKFKLFKETYKGFLLTVPELADLKQVFAGIPMFEVRADAAPVVGYLNFPGIEDCDFALPVFGESMLPTLEPGSWAALKLIPDRAIVFGELYYVEWGGYKMYRRLLAGSGAEVIASSDNTALVGDQAQYAPFAIRVADIKKLCLVKHVHRQLHH